MNGLINEQDVWEPLWILASYYSQIHPESGNFDHKSNTMSGSQQSLSARAGSSHVHIQATNTMISGTIVAIGLIDLTPASARMLAEALNGLADRVEGKGIE